MDKYQRITWEQLLHQLRSREYLVLLEGFRKGKRLFRFQSWIDVIEGLAEDNAILGAILDANAEVQDNRWQTVLLAMLWERLLSTQERLWWWEEKDPKELWSIILVSFLRTINCVCASERRDRIAERIRWGTYHRLYEHYSREWARQDRQEIVDPEKCKSWAIRDTNILDWEDREEREAEVERLRRYLSKGLISESDFDLLVATAFGDLTIVEYVARHGLSYDRVKKQRWRALAKIKRLKG